MTLPIFAYCDVVWSPHSIGCSQKLHRLKNQVARGILQSPLSVRSSEALNRISPEKSRMMHVSISVFKSLKDIAPSDISKILIQNFNFCSYNTRRKNDLHLPKVKGKLGKKSFRFNGPFQYDKLPPNVKVASSILSFRSQILKYLHNWILVHILFGFLYIFYY